MVAGAIGICYWFIASGAPFGVAPNILAIQPARVSDEIACPEAKGSESPLLLLVLGQSNAGNHGETRSESAYGGLWLDGHCYRIADPLAGGTGSAGSIWSRLAASMGLQHSHRQLLLVVFAIDASRATNWIAPGPISTKLVSIGDALRSHHLTVSAVLWQQGEADARSATSHDDYAAALTILIHRLREAGISAPVLLARSTRCRNAPNVAIRDAIAGVAGREPDVYVGPDTDALGDEYRFDGCHFNDAGLQRAAALWADALRQHHFLAVE